MKARMVLVVLTISLLGSGCAWMDHAFCASSCHTQDHNASSLVSFLYPDGKIPPQSDAIPELHVPLRVGLAFLPSQGYGSDAKLDAAHKEQLLERIRQRFADRKFVSEIVVIPDYYLTTNKGFSGLEGVQRLYNIDLMALVSYDQVSNVDDNNLSLGYITIVGAYVLKGTRHDVTTLVDLAVVSPATRSLVLRAGGTDTRHGNTTLVDADREKRVAGSASFDGATDQMIEHFDTALTKFEADVREGKANVRVVKRESTRGSSGGGGASGVLEALVLAMLLAARIATRRSRPVADVAIVE
jgi:rhombotail lipoprotein